MGIERYTRAVKKGVTKVLQGVAVLGVLSGAAHAEVPKTEQQKIVEVNKNYDAVINNLKLKTISPDIQDAEGVAKAYYKQLAWTRDAIKQLAELHIKAGGSLSPETQQRVFKDVARVIKNRVAEMENLKLAIERGGTDLSSQEINEKYTPHAEYFETGTGGSINITDSGKPDDWAKARFLLSVRQ